MLKTLGRETKGFRLVSVLTPIFMIAEVIMERILPKLMASIIDNGVTPGNMQVIYTVGAQMVVAALFGLLFGILGAVAGSHAATGFARNLRRGMFRNIQTFSFANIDKYSTAGLVTRMTTDVTNIQNAYQMLLRMSVRAPASMIVERPLSEGRIRSFDLVSKMLRYFLRRVVGKRAAFRPRLLLALPGGMAPSERQTLVDVIVDAGVRSVVPVDENVAAAIGAGIRIDQPYGRMNIDIGGGRTNVSVFSFGHQIVWDILDTGGDKFDEAIVDYLRKKHNLLIGARTAEELKINIGSARMRGAKLEMDACGRSLVSGLPRAVTVNSEELIEALDEPLRELISALHRIIERTPPELASDIFDEGITLSGGGAQLFGLSEVISDQLRIRTTLADEPDLCVAHGLSALIDDADRYENVDLVSGSRSDVLRDE